MRPHRTERRDKGAPPLCPPGIHPATRRRGGLRGRGTRPRKGIFPASGSHGKSSIIGCRFSELNCQSSRKSGILCGKGCFSPHKQINYTYGKMAAVGQPPGQPRIGKGVASHEASAFRALVTEPVCPARPDGADVFSLSPSHIGRTGVVHPLHCAFFLFGRNSFAE